MSENGRAAVFLRPLKRAYMLRNLFRKGAALLLAAAVTVFHIGLPFAEGTALTVYADSFSGTVSATSLNVRSGPGTGYGSVTKLAQGTRVSVLEETRGSDGMTWYRISTGSGNGYVRSDYIRRQQTYAANDASFEDWMNGQGFPESYKNDLRGIHQQYPSWILKAQQTGLDWETVIREESRIGRNLVYKDSVSSWKSTADGAFDWAGNYWPGFDGAVWQQASEEVIRYYMDPRNFLSEPGIFQFEVQTYDPSIQTKQGLISLVKGTFLEGNAVVPVSGSQVQGGTPVTGNVGSYSGVSYTGGTSSSSVAYGPGNSGYVESGPGVGLSGYSAGSSNASSGPGAVSSSAGSSSAGSSAAAPSSGSGSGISFEGPPLLNILSGISMFGFRLMGGIDSYANWEQTGDGTWYFRGADGGYYHSGWFWIDGNADGTAECYYFYGDGKMAASTEIDGYPVNSDGQWVKNGTVERRTVSAAPASTQYSADLNGATWKSVPYVDILMKAAEVSNTSPYVLASMIIQEQGAKGRSDLISGTNAQYPGYYNFYNIGAYAHENMGAVEAGLKYASESGSGDRPWNNVEKALIGGAKMYGANYVNNGQDTFYLKKFNVQGSNIYNHQYMTNVPAAAEEGSKVSAAYTADIKNTALVFRIPVYANMPQVPAELPTLDGNPNNKLASLSVDGFVLTPTFSMDTNDYSLIVEEGVSSVNVSARTIDSGASVSGTGQRNLGSGLNSLVVSVRAANGSVRDYRISITRRGSGGGAAVTDPSGGSGTPQYSTPSGGPGVRSGGTAASAPGSSGNIVIGEAPF